MPKHTIKNLNAAIKKSEESSKRTIQLMLSDSESSDDDAVNELWEDAKKTYYNSFSCDIDLPLDQPPTTDLGKKNFLDFYNKMEQLHENIKFIALQKTFGNTFEVSDMEDDSFFHSSSDMFLLDCFILFIYCLNS